MLTAQDLALAPLCSWLRLSLCRAPGVASNTKSDTPTEAQDQPSPLPDSSRPPFLSTRRRLGYILYPEFREGRTTRLGPRTFIKACICNDATEAATLRFIARHTTIPVPKVRRVFCSNGRRYILMDFVRNCVQMDVAWRRWPADTRRRAVEQLKGYMGQLRALPPPAEGIVASVTGGPLLDNGRMGETFGPFSSHDDFHRFLRAEFSLEDFSMFQVKMDDIMVVHRRRYLTKFTHGDFAPRNILVTEDGTVVAIVDWETAGWYPEYWEFTKARYTLEHMDWTPVIGEMTGTYEQEFQAEAELWARVYLGWT